MSESTSSESQAPAVQPSVGQVHKLPVLRIVGIGAYLDAGTELGEVLIPNRELPEETKAGDTLEVFLSHDSEDRLIATTELPYAAVGEFALLQVIAVEKVGAFLDWGLQKDLFLPYAEQTRRPEAGDDVIVFVYLDNTGRIASSMRIERHVQKDNSVFSVGQEVECLVFGKTDLGYKAIINGSHLGVFFQNEVFKPLQYGQFTKAFIKNLREDGKIDLSLQNTDAGVVIDAVQTAILEQLQANDGFLAINDKTPAEEIYRLFQASKKKYKMALGGLYKQRRLRVEDDGIYLV